MKNKIVFNNFEEYWYYAKILSTEQRDIILSSLTTNQRKKLMLSYREGGWEDLVVRNELDRIIDQIKNEVGVDLMGNKCKIVAGKSVCVRKSQWNYVQDIFKKYKKQHTDYILGGIKSEKLDDKMLLLVKG